MKVFISLNGIKRISASQTFLQKSFYESPTLLPIFANQNKSKRYFCFYEKHCYCTNIGKCFC